MIRARKLPDGQVVLEHRRAGLQYFDKIGVFSSVEAACDYSAKRLPFGHDVRIVNEHGEVIAS